MLLPPSRVTASKPVPGFQIRMPLPEQITRHPSRLKETAETRRLGPSRVCSASLSIPGAGSPQPLNERTITSGRAALLLFLNANIEPLHCHHKNNLVNAPSPQQDRAVNLFEFHLHW